MDKCDLIFELSGKGTISVDHGYALGTAIFCMCPAIKGDKDVAISLLDGNLSKKPNQLLVNGAKFFIRAPLEIIGHLAKTIANSEFKVGTTSVSVGNAMVCPLVARPDLRSRLVVIKGYHQDPEEFHKAVWRQLKSMGIKSGLPYLIPDTGRGEGNYRKRAVRVQDKKVVGFEVEVLGLSPLESIILQDKGLGGKQRYGCGIMVGDQRCG